MEFAAELSDIYGELFELEMKRPLYPNKPNELNRLGEKSIENGRRFCDYVYAYDEDARYEYL